MSNKRVFVPSSKNANTTVERWTWTKSGGLCVEFMDGFKCKSAWGSLPEFLKAVRESREVAVREVSEA